MPPKYPWDNDPLQEIKHRGVPDLEKRVRSKEYKIEIPGQFYPQHDPNQPDPQYSPDPRFDYHPGQRQEPFYTPPPGYLSYDGSDASELRFLRRPNAGDIETEWHPQDSEAERRRMEAFFEDYRLHHLESGDPRAVFEELRAKSETKEEEPALLDWDQELFAFEDWPGDDFYGL